MSALREWLIRILRVPPEPAAPEGAPGSLQVFRAAPAFYWLKVFKWSVGQVSAVIGLVAALTFVQSDWSHDLIERFPRATWIRGAIAALEVLGWIGFLLQLPVTWMIQRLEYEMHWYLLTDRSLRIRSGIWVVEELTMTYANIQELTVHQGPLERILGLSNLRVRSAGGGSSGGRSGGHEPGDAAAATHVALFRGVADARALRDCIVAHLRICRGSGLGDPDARPTPETGSGSGSGAGEPETVAVSASVLAAAGELLGEARGLRQAVESRAEGGSGGGA